MDCQITMVNADSIPVRVFRYLCLNMDINFAALMSIKYDKDALEAIFISGQNHYK